MATNDNALSCQSNIQFYEMLAAALGKEASGKVYLRTHKVTAVAGSKAIACQGSGIDEETLEIELGRVFCIDANGDIAIRISQTT